METLTAAQFKARFSEVLEKIRRGQRIAITYGRKREKVAIIIPYSESFEGGKRKIGLLEGKASFKVRKGFKLTDEEMLQA